MTFPRPPTQSVAAVQVCMEQSRFDSVKNSDFICSSAPEVRCAASKAKEARPRLLRFGVQILSGLQILPGPARPHLDSHVVF